MKTLSINTEKQHQIVVTLTIDEQTFMKEREQQFGSQVLISLIEEVLAEAGISFSDLDQISVSKGPGSFTGLRVGVAVANALGYSLGIPVNGKKMEVDLEYA